MSDIDVDVKNLFKKIGGVEPAYQEIKRQSRTDQARERWPLLHSLQAEEGEAKSGPVESDIVFPPPKPAKISEIRPSKKSGISKLFKSLEGAKETAEVGVLIHLAQKEPLSGLFAAREETPKQEPEAGLLKKQAESPPPARKFFDRLFEPGPPANFWQSMFDKLKKS